RRRLRRLTMARQVLLFIWFLSLSSALGQVSYSIPEEMAKGSLVGSIAQDLGLDLKRLKSGKARIYTGDSAEYIELNKERGVLLIKERIDREALCGKTTPCALHLQIILDNPMELFRVTVEITDINDNSPIFKRNERRFEISESAVVGSKFMLEKAIDADIGANDLQSYFLQPTDHFNLKLHGQSDGSKKVEMILQKPLDREKQENMSLILTAIDGGEPPKSGTVQIYVTVLDINDNAPVFTKPIYRAIITENSQSGTPLVTVRASDSDKGTNGDVSYLIKTGTLKINIILLDANDNAPVFSQSVYTALVAENASMGSLVVKVSATDADQGTNKEVSYSFSESSDSILDTFNIDLTNGDITVIGPLDFEKSKKYELNVVATDIGGLTDTAKVMVEITDVNDNAPVINVISFSNPLPENSAPETVIAMLNVKDLDSGKNGQVRCLINPSLPFQIRQSSSNFYSLITDQLLDREKMSEYNITITAIDEGSPSFSTNKTLILKLSDVNDNAPVFQRQSYTAYVMENNSPGVSVLSVKAHDKDSGNNARISYFLEDILVNGVSASTFISVNAESGEILAVRSFDYDIRVKAQDGGNPPLSSNVSVKIMIQDQNDNAPQVLYPVQSGASVVAEIVPRSADVGYLVTKVVAVDVDSGQNAWLSYKLQKATDRALFEVGLQNGEIRTVRQVTDKDAVKQRLTVVVEDNGQPSRSATVNVNVAVADSFPEVLSEFTDFTHDKDYNDNLTFYLVLALAVVSFLFIVSIIAILSVKCYRWRRERMFYKSGANLPVIPYYPPLYADVGGTGTLQQVYNYEVCRTTDSRKSDLKYGRPCSESIISLDSSGTQTLTHAQRAKLNNEDSYDQVS
uniref:Cadherin domain-containing protein n=2 Tax=Sinocyclocheilus rhinocerous TaxID=307959 RepID=A0A673KZJ3_9TELE